jgi:hydrogenase-4 component B
VSGWLLVIVCLAPIAGVLFAWTRAAPVLALLAALICFAVALTAPIGSMLELEWVLLGSHLALLDTDRWFLAAAGLIWSAAGFYAAFSIRGTLHAGRFWFFFSLAMSGNFILILGQDLLTFYLGFTVMGLASYGLIVHSGNKSALYAGRIYLIMTLLGEFALFVGFVVLTAGDGQTNNLPAQLLLLVAFGIKAGLFGMHMWLPLAHPAAPEPASAVLSGVMIKAALIGWMRFLPFGEETMLTIGTVLLTLGLAGTVFATFVGVIQREAKTVLAYSSIAKMGLMSAALGIAALEPLHAPIILLAVAIFAVHHGVVKAALFLSVGVVKTTHRKWIWVAVIPVVAMVGLPFTSGASAKAVLKTALEPVQSSWLVMLEWVLMFATVATFLLMARFLVLLYGLSEVTRPSWKMTVIPCAVLCIASFVLVPVLGLAPIKVIDAGLLSLAAIVSILSFKFYPSSLRSIVIPAGDLIVPIDSLFRKIGRSRWLKINARDGLQISRFDGISIRPMLASLEKTIAQPGVSTALWFGVFILILLNSISLANQ